MELWGNLKDFSLPDVIQLVGFGRKTGVLSVEHEGIGSMLYFANGNVVHALSGEVVGEEAVYQLFRVEGGEFRFKADIAPPTQTIFMDPTNLVMEAARLLDESSRAKEEPPPAEEPEPEPEPQAEEAVPEPIEVSQAVGAVAFEEVGVEEVEAAPVAETITPAQARSMITALLEQRFGKESKRLTQAVQKCGDAIGEFHELAVRVERFVSAFVDPRSATEVGNQLRDIIRRMPGGS